MQLANKSVSNMKTCNVAKTWQKPCCQEKMGAEAQEAQRPDKWHKTPEKGVRTIKTLQGWREWHTGSSSGIATSGVRLGGVIVPPARSQVDKRTINPPSVRHNPGMV